MVLAFLLTRPCDWYWLTDKFVTPIQFRLPKGFKGTIFLIYDEMNGIEIIKKEGKYIIHIPPNGIVSVRPISGLKDPATKLSAIYDDGTSIPISRKSFITGSRSGEPQPTIQTLLVGTEKEIHMWLFDSRDPREQLKEKLAEQISVGDVQKAASEE